MLELSQKQPVKQRKQNFKFSIPIQSFHYQVIWPIFLMILNFPLYRDCHNKLTSRVNLGTKIRTFCQFHLCFLLNQQNRYGEWVICKNKSYKTIINQMALLRFKIMGSMIFCKEKTLKKCSVHHFFPLEHFFRLLSGILKISWNILRIILLETSSELKCLGSKPFFMLFIGKRREKTKW